MTGRIYGIVFYFFVIDFSDLRMRKTIAEFNFPRQSVDGNMLTAEIKYFFFCFFGVFCTVFENDKCRYSLDLYRVGDADNTARFDQIALRYYVFELLGIYVIPGCNDNTLNASLEIKKPVGIK